MRLLIHAITLRTWAVGVKGRQRAATIGVATEHALSIMALTPLTTVRQPAAEIGAAAAKAVIDHLDNDMAAVTSTTLALARAR